MSQELRIVKSHPDPADALSVVRSTTASNDADMPAGQRLVEVAKGIGKRVGLMPIELAKLGTGILSAMPGGPMTIGGGVAELGAQGTRALDAIAGPLRPTNDFQGFGALATDAATIGATPSLGLTSKAVRGVSRAAMKWGLRPSPTLLREFPTVVDDALEEGIAMTNGGQRKWTQAIQQSNQDTLNAIADARRAGARVNEIDVVDPALVSARERAARVAQTGQTTRAQGIADSIAEREAGMRGVFAPSGTMDPVAAHQNKLMHQMDAEQAYRKQIAGQSINDADLLMDEGSARAYRGAIEAIAPATKTSNARTQKLIGIGKAMDTSRAKAGSHVLSEYFTVAGALSGNPQLAIPAALLAKPGWSSKLALTIDKFRNSPDLLGAAIKALVLESVMADSGTARPVASHERER